MRISRKQLIPYFQSLMNMLESDKALRFEDVMQDEKDGRQPSWYYIYSINDIDQGRYHFLK